MKRFTTLVAALIVVAAAFSTANAAVIVNDNLEGYTSQANFEATWVPIGTAAPISATWSTAQASSPTHSAEILGEAAVNAKQRNRRTFADTSALVVGSQLIWSFDFYDSSAAAAPYRQFSNMQDTAAPSGTNQLIAMGLNNNQTSAANGGNYYMARILGLTPEDTGGTSGSFFKLNDFGVGLRSTGWHNLKAVLTTDDGLSTDFAFYVDNTLAETVLNVGTAAQMRQYDNLVIGSGLSNGNNAAYYDNYYLEFIPPNTPPTVVDAVIGPPYNANEPGEPQTLTHQFTATDAETPLGPFTWDQLMLSSYTPAYGGVGPGPAVAATMSGTGMFNWVSEGSPRGIYIWQARATDTGGLSDTGSLTVHVTHVPEPSTIVLVGLALAGLCGLVRRK